PAVLDEEPGAVLLDEVLGDLPGQSLWKGQADPGAAGDRRDGGEAENELVVEDAGPAADHGASPGARRVREPETGSDVVPVEPRASVRHRGIHASVRGQAVRGHVVPGAVVELQAARRLPAVLREERRPRVPQSGARLAEDVLI